MSPARPVAPGLLLALGGVLIASVSAMCGIGGGIFAVPVLHYVYGVSLKRAVATALCLVWFVAASSTVAEAVRPEPALYPGVIAILVVGVLAGTQIGFEVAKRIPTRALKGVFCFVLVGVGVQILAGSGGAVPSGAEEVHLDLTHTLTVAGIGLGAGIVVPIMGVGGGLIVVPALLFGMPEVGFVGARATSLVAAVFSSSRSLWLYQREGMVDWRTGAWFGGGAAVGAAIGVELVHRPGGAAVGKVLLGVVLIFAALRFGLDVGRGGRRMKIEVATDE